MSVCSLTELHTPCQTLSFSTVGKEQHFIKSVSRMNPVFQLILTVTILTVNMGWNTGFSPVTNLNKGCSLLREAIRKKSKLVMEFFRKGSDPPPPPYFRKLWNP
jgi:hypothetical protein